MSIDKLEVGDVRRLTDGSIYLVINHNSELTGVWFYHLDTYGTAPSTGDEYLGNIFDAMIKLKESINESR